MYIIIKHMAAIRAFQIPRCLILALSACVYRLGHVQMDDDGDELGDEGELGFPPGSFRPGRVVWAKVDGHEWWPAKVKLRCHHLHDTTSAVHSTRAMLQVLSCLNARWLLNSSGVLDGSLQLHYIPALCCFQVTSGCCQVHNYG